MRKTADAARGKWKGILLTLGVDSKHLTGKHGPCPMCGGSDRFRFDNKDGSGSWICNQCGAGHGLDLLMQVEGWDFKKAADAVDRVLGNVRSDPPCKPVIDENERRRLLNSLWKSSCPIASDNPAGVYLARRVPGIDCCKFPDLRFAPACPVPGGGKAPALVALVRDTQTRDPVTIHRTFLTDCGHKAAMANPRALMPGALPESAAVVLGEPGGALGIAEGIETALAAAMRFGVPCWAAINSTLLKKFVPPATLESVFVMGDCDAKFGGQAAAYSLAHRLSRTLEVEVKIPGHENPFGTDWASAA